MNELIKITGLTKKYQDLIVLDKIDLTLEAGKIIGLLGSNGSGKTTLMKILAGLSKEYEGEVLVANQRIGINSRKLISYLPDESYLQGWSKIADVLNFFNDMYDDFEIGKCLALIGHFNLNQEMKIKNMSEGMKEKFQICLVMSRKAKIYLLDEPLARVDSTTRTIVLDTILNNYSEDAIIIISTNLIGELETIFDEVIFLNEGKIILHQETEELRMQKKQSIDETFRRMLRC